MWSGVKKKDGTLGATVSNEHKDPAENQIWAEPQQENKARKVVKCVQKKNYIII